MSTRHRARPTVRRNPTILRAGLLLVIASICAALSHQLIVPSSSTAMSAGGVLQRDQRGARDEADGRVPGGKPDGAVDQADGVVPDGTTVFDEEVPGVANIDPALLSALRLAASDAADDGVVLFVESGWRSAEYQELLFRQAVVTYGSEEEAARWVASMDTSAHVSGVAVDIAYSDALAWLSEHGAGYGLCQIYTNEPWHYELRADAFEHGCPPMYADPTSGGALMGGLAYGDGRDGAEANGGSARTLVSEGGVLRAREAFPVAFGMKLDILAISSPTSA